jgi:two-component system, OmpR family, sensor histidine kinase CiaH
MFNKTLKKLTISYVVVLSIVCISFSMALYSVSVNSLGRSLRRPLPPGFQIRMMEEWREQRYEDAKMDLSRQLIFLNLLLIGASSVAAYFLAKKHIQPLEESYARQKDFTSSAAHDLKTPLAAMLIDADLALRSKKATVAELKQALESGREEIIRLDSHINRLLTVAMIEGGGEDVIQNSFNLPQVVRDSVERNSALLKLHKMPVEFANSFPADQLVLGDAQIARRVLDEVLTNCIKYGKSEHGIKIDIEVKAKNVTLIIQDFGAGILLKDLPRVRDKFFRADKARTRSDQSGNGFGLSIVDQSMKQMGGSMDIDSAAGKGTIVKLVFRAD